MMYRFIVVTVLVFVSILARTQVIMEMGVFTPNSVKIEKTQVDKHLKLSYVANADRIQEFENYELVDELIVVSISFQTERISYDVVNRSGNTFTLTYRIRDKVLVMANSAGNYRRVSGEGLSFTHQY